MAFSPQVQTLPVRKERRQFAIHPSILSLGAIAIVFVALITAVAILGVPQLDPQAQMFVTP
jgi:Tfp pilus assembly protein PilN